jgi:hypothetical protein
MINWKCVKKELPKTPFYSEELNKVGFASPYRDVRWSKVVLVKLETQVWGMATLTIEKFPARPGLEEKILYTWHPYNTTFADSDDWRMTTMKDIEKNKEKYFNLSDMLGEGRRVTHWSYVRLYKKRKK